LRARCARHRPGTPTLKAVNDLVVGAAVKFGVENGSKPRVDTTVVETDIHHPTDNTLLWDVVRVLTRLLGRLTEASRPQSSSAVARATAQLLPCPAAPGEPRNAHNTRASALQPANDIDTQFGVGANHLSNERQRTPHWQAKLVTKKRWKCSFRRTILPSATETGLAIAFVVSIF
jgi:hypothetical protein